MLFQRLEPQLRPVPRTARGFRVRVDLAHTKPPVWRRIDVPGDITLPRLHEVLQAAMGWSDSHLHRFRMGDDRNAPEFLTQFDLDEGEQAMLEDGVRLDQIVAAQGDRLWYDYDFGDGWEHVLRVEEVLEAPPAAPACVAGELACPPENCGDPWGYREIAAWVRSGYDDADLPEAFENAREARAWLPPSWHPDAFDLDETNQMITMVTAEPGPLTEELASLVEYSQSRGMRGLRDALAHPASHGPTEVSADAAAAMTEPFRIQLDVVGEGASLTSAGYLKPADVLQIAQRLNLTDWWPGTANREDLTWPVAQLRAVARTVGLVSVRKGRITPTQAARRCAGDPAALLDHIVGRLPVGSSDAERHAGWAALAVAGRETPAELWEQETSGLIFELGWRDGRDGYSPPDAGSPTLTVLSVLAGTPYTRGRATGVNGSVAAVARAAARP